MLPIFVLCLAHCVPVIWWSSSSCSPDHLLSSSNLEALCSLCMCCLPSHAIIKLCMCFVGRRAALWSIQHLPVAVLLLLCSFSWAGHRQATLACLLCPQRRHRFHSSSPAWLACRGLQGKRIHHLQTFLGGRMGSFWSVWPLVVTHGNYARQTDGTLCSCYILHVLGRGCLHWSRGFAVDSNAQAFAANKARQRGGCQQVAQHRRWPGRQGPASSKSACLARLACFITACSP